MKGKSRIIARGLLGSKRTKRFKEAKDELCRRARRDPVARRALRDIAPDAHLEVPAKKIQATRERLMERAGGANTLRIRNEFVDRGAISSEIVKSMQGKGTRKQGAAAPQ